MNDSQTVIVRIVRSINDALTDDNVDRLAAMLRDTFHDDMVIKGPDLTTVGSGKDACVQSYVDFRTTASVTSFETSDPHVDVFGDTAVATFGWKMSYTIEAQPYDESGHDVFVFTRGQERWQAVWRALLA